jgi:predicted Zn-dependent protease
MKNSFPIIILTLLSINLTACMTAPISGKKSMNFITEGQERKMGEDAYAEVMTKEKIMTDARYVEPIRRTGLRIAGAANRPDFKWEFNVIDSETMNAFCLPGGKIAFYRGIFPIALNEAGAAAIMGHEVGHAIARHGAQRISMNMAMVGGLSVLQGTLLKDNPKKDNLMALLGMGSQVGVALPFSRSNENEADEIGIILMARAGYDPSEAPLIWERFEKVGGGKPPELLSTHPSEGKRRDHLRELMTRAMEEYNKAPVKYGKGENLPI